MKSRVGERGQVTIPKRLRKRLGIEPGQEVQFEERKGLLVMRKSAPQSSPIDSLLGVLGKKIDVDAYLEQSRGPSWTDSLDQS